MTATRKMAKIARGSIAAGRVPYSISCNKQKRKSKLI